MKHHQFYTKAFSLIEVLIFVSILSLFFITAATITTASLRNMKINEHKIIGVRFGEELLEWIRGEKERDWEAFLNLAGPGNKTYCFNTALLSIPLEGACSGYDLNGIYKREAVLSAQSSSQVNVSITVEWKELGSTYRTSLTSSFTSWE